MKKIDAHQHFWKYDPVDYAWISEPMRAIARDYFPQDLAPLQEALGFEGSVAVQARQSLEENDFLLGLAETHERVKGVVGWVDLRSPRVEEQLDRYAGHPKFVGVRHVVQDEPDDRFLLRPDFMRGVGWLHAYHLTYDLLTYPRQLPAAIEFVRAFPDHRFVLDHISKPFIKEGTLSPWDTHIRQLAAFDNVYCKLSGMVTEADWAAWKAADFRPYLEVVVEAFGTSRLMIGSDWPVCEVAASYAEVMQIVTDFIEQFSPAEQAAILGGNCMAFYGLE